MTALSSKNAAAGGGPPSLPQLVRAVRTCSDIESACRLLESLLQELQIALLSVKFCDIDDKRPAIRPFGRYPCVISQLAVDMRERGGCPMTKEAVKRLVPFDALAISEQDYPDFLSKRFLQELRKVEHSHIAVVPVVIGQGLMLITAGLGKREFEGELRDQLVSVVCCFGAAIVNRFSEIAVLFESEILSRLEARVLFLFCSGFRPSQISETIDLNEVTIMLILRSVIRKLGAANIGEAIAKALAMGEIGNLQPHMSHPSDSADLRGGK
ncbi:helix-turn-helix transcriptional regulator [Salaquimonas pukyongi]|uniref:helix-turn-helix transcriptional regulator n=1 Tax=Salaquimonas pukyongi TaxID=2712698 RepID=UPI0013BE9C67|nr:LuxR C-terminal-related transcriptional regulator [Salaquimonas pukyongi]